MYVPTPYVVGHIALSPFSILCPLSLHILLQKCNLLLVLLSLLGFLKYSLPQKQQFTFKDVRIVFALQDFEQNLCVLNRNALRNGNLQYSHIAVSAFRLLFFPPFCISMIYSIEILIQMEWKTTKLHGGADRI
jgi:hypothetical protein